MKQELQQIKGERYQVRRIEDAEMTSLDAQVLCPTDDLAEAKECAGSADSQWGAAIVDFQTGTVDWGHCVTPIGEPAIAVRG